MSQDTLTLPRRRLLAGGALAGASLALPGALRSALAQAPMTVGVIYVGPRNDFGYNQAQAAGRRGAEEAARREGGRRRERARDRRRAEDHGGHDQPGRRRRCSSPPRFGYFDPHMLAMAAKYPKVRFAHCGGMWTEGKHPKNTGSYFGYIDECQYLNGVVAGHMSKSKKLGFVAAKPIPQVLRNINAFTLGARSVDPSITTQRHLHRRLVACRSRKPRPPTA